MVAVKLLEKSGHSVCAVSNGVEALQMLASEPFDVVVLDMRMPELDGLETARRIRAGEGAHARIPLVALTGDVLPEERALAHEAGMEYFLAKPVSKADLDRVMARVSETRGSG